MHPFITGEKFTKPFQVGRVSPTRTSSDACLMHSQMDIPLRFRLRPVLRPTPSGLMVDSSLHNQKAPGHTKTRRRTINTSRSTRRTRRKHKRPRKLPITCSVIPTFLANKDPQDSHKDKDNRNNRLRVRRTRVPQRMHHLHTRRNRPRHRRLHLSPTRRSRPRMRRWRDKWLWAGVPLVIQRAHRL